MAKTKTAGTIDALRALMASGAWRDAILMAAKFPRLPPEARGRILSAREAYLRPEFQLELGRSLDDLVVAGREALIEAYGQQSVGV